ncbi:hypothetical protein GV794_05505 [Nocardia cyriacigeorgica]|uniref:DUF732 domain-containing protein n=1 Tax=Nocardia cyriacigeorgica TaxID=135487 RepID=A0A6P1D4R6_9NOCA|nr:hypothetical protein [Nocardia cyriacigeorgica]NEW37595.1 hypothetical protein [Nocardia cyriacigeorgica]NEW45038.1 hypothetical protein [Nocardia cyriacigeorgica]NEW49017.1 hypothetical protein [Nocardia cyriacigeorgica]NEW55118.1 hypothetical protein [Nocardia cyriacigeorgica]
MRPSPSGRRPARAGLAVGVILAAAMLGACSDDSGDDRPPDPDPPAPEQVSPVAAEQLCEMILVDIGSWQEHGPTVGRISFEGYVRAWTAEYENFDAVIIRDHSFVDTMTIQYCPEVRERALDALELPDLASGLVGYT